MIRVNKPFEVKGLSIYFLQILPLSGGMIAKMLHNYDRYLLEVCKTPALIVHGFDHWNVQKRITELAT